MSLALRDRKRLVVKVGSALLRAPQGGLRETVVAHIVQQLSTLRQQGHEVLLVSSGAVALGIQVLGEQGMPRTIVYQQAAAAIGQSHLIWTYERLFGASQQKVAQILLTHEDLRSRTRYLNARNTLLTLLHYGVIPIINENDTVSVEEIRFGDNDTLSAMVCNLVDADVLIILTHLEGLYTADPREHPEATLIPVVERLDARIEAMASSATHRTGRGGMASKIRAAKIAGVNGIHTHIANGVHPDAVLRILAGEQVGTHIHPPATTRLSSRKRWIGYALKARGEIMVNDGARLALTAHGKSLLPAGIVHIAGDFRFGDPVVCVDVANHRFAQGLVNYSAAELHAIRGQQTSSIETVLGYKGADEVIHRDNLVVFTSAHQA
ncbi:MAG: glutamate 5-kinase [Candidatus Tectomicrobia bacterium]|uniref:Glutamate 5-kinase n=1 Tax=Tectimicrobiota bacterium TaxID=2528274 RepID=A0A937VZQ6_UNCTE|nr:glutamate 5-kinase [Candidatus Tectomicrobia bacterium]